MNLRFGRKAYEPNARMQAALTRWLRAIEPTGTPIALRLRTFADLREEAEQTRRLPWLAPTLSSAASLGAALLGLGLLAMLALASASLSAGIGSSGQPYPPDQLDPAPQAEVFWGLQDPVMLSVLFVISCLVGALVFLPWVRAAAHRLAFGKDAPAPAEPLPFRRPWRSVPRLTWFLAALTVGTLILTIQSALRDGTWLPSAQPFELQRFFLFCMQLLTTPMALALAWRYPSRDRSSRLLLLWALASLATQLYDMALVPFGTTLPLEFTWLLPFFVTAAGLSLLAAGLAGRSGSVPRPPIRLAALGLGGTLLLDAFLATELYEGVGWPIEVVYPASIWLASTASLAVAWVGLAAARRRGASPAWRAVLAAGLLAASAVLIIPLQLFVFYSGLYLPIPGSIPDQWTVISLWSTLGWTLAVGALLAALLAGLRPVSVDGPPSVETSAAMPIART